jgi:hypothetical protein
MAFTDQERVDIRRFCGYPLYGGTPSGFQSYRFFQAYGTLEYRLTNLSANEESTVRSTYLTGPNNLFTLEQAITASSANLDTDAAAVWTHNKNEVRDRRRLFDYSCKQLMRFLGIPPGPNFAGDSGTISLIV